MFLLLASHHVVFHFLSFAHVYLPRTIIGDHALNDNAMALNLPCTDLLQTQEEKCMVRVELRGIDLLPRLGVLHAAGTVLIGRIRSVQRREVYTTSEKGHVDGCHMCFDARKCLMTFCPDQLRPATYYVE